MSNTHMKKLKRQRKLKARKSTSIEENGSKITADFDFGDWGVGGSIPKELYDFLSNPNIPVEEKRLLMGIGN